MLDFPIWHLRLSIGLWMIRWCNFMLHSIMFQTFLKLSIAKVWTTIINQHSWSTKPAKDVPLEEFDYGFGISLRSCHCFNPLCHISTGTKMYSFEKEDWNGPTKSIPQQSKAFTSKMIISVISCLFEIPPILWQLLYCCTYLCASLNKVGQ